MKKHHIAWLLIAAAALVSGLALGALVLAPKLERDAAASAAAKPAEREILYWVAPMDPDYRRDGPGKSPMGMDLVPVYADEQAPPAKSAEPEILYWVAPMDPNYRRDGPGKSPMGMDLVPVYAEPESGDAVDADSIRIAPEVEHNLGVRTETVALRPLWRRVEATGYVGFDEDLISRLHTRAAGWAENVQVETIGQRVRRGDLLFEFYSPEILNAQKEYLLARQSGQDRLLRAAREKLVALGVVASEIEALERRGAATRTIRVEAPQDGVVTELRAREGMYLEPATEVLSLSDLSHVWVLAEVFESQADWVARGQSAEARLAYLPGEVFSGTVDYVYPVLDPQTRTLRVRLHFDNPGERLKPNMYGAVTIFGKTHVDALTVHRDALIRAADNDRVIVALGDGRYQAREVMTGIESGEWIQVIAGLEAGERVVTSAQFLLDSEASLSGSFRRLDDYTGSREGQGPVNVFGAGIVEQVDRGARSLIIRHGPIDALGWPGMTMKFETTTAVDLGRVQAGQNVHFAIEPGPQGVYRVTMIHGVESAADKVAEPESSESDHGSMDHGSMDHGSMDHGSMDHGGMRHD